MKFRVAIVVLVSSLMMQSPLAAEESYPDHPIQIIVPYSPGGAADVIARPFAAALQKQLNIPIVIINKPGASGEIGNRYVAEAEPNGYTLLITVVQVSILPLVDQLQGRNASYKLSQLKGIARLTADPVVVMARPSTHFESFDQLINAAKAKPDELTYSSGGPFSGIQIPMELLSRAAGIKLVDVPYKGGGPSMLGFLGDEVGLTAQVPGVAQKYIAAGSGIPLVQTGSHRLASLPNVPTAKELGYDVEFYLWAGLFAPSEIPSSILSKLEKATAAAMKDPVLVNLASKAMVELGYQDPDTFNVWWKKDAASLQNLVKEIDRGSR